MARKKNSSKYSFSTVTLPLLKEISNDSSKFAEFTEINKGFISFSLKGKKRVYHSGNPENTLPGGCILLMVWNMNPD